MLLQLPVGCWGWCLPQTAPQKLSPLLKNIMNRDRNNYLHLPTVLIFHSTWCTPVCATVCISRLFHVDVFNKTNSLCRLWKKRRINLSKNMLMKENQFLSLKIGGWYIFCRISIQMFLNHSPKEILNGSFWGLIFGPIQSSLSLEIWSTPPPPPLIQ